MMNKYHRLLLACLLCFAGALFGKSRAHWIWSAQSRLAQNETVFFRYDFDLPEEAVSGRIGFSGDDNYTIYINGKQVRKKTSFFCEPMDAKGVFVKGHNCIAAAVTNVVSQAGLLIFAEFTVKGETTPRVLFTHKDWVCKIAPKNDSGDLRWTLPTTPKPNWPQAKLVRDVTEKSTWRSRIKEENFMTAEEYARYKEDRVNGQQKMQTMIKAAAPALATIQAPKEVRFVRHDNLPFLSVDGKELPFPMYNAWYLDATTPEHFFRIKRFYDAGHRLFLQGVRMDTDDFWKQDGTVDIAPIERRLNALLAAAPDAYIHLLVRLVPPRWYMEQHLQEMTGYGSNAKLVPAGDELKSPIMRPSMASETWMKDAGRILAEYVRKLEATPAGKRIVMYHTAYGIYTEWHYFGMVKDLPDTSKPMQKAFTAYLKEKYPNDKALQKAWIDASVTLDTAQIPSAKQRMAIKDGDIFVPGSDCRVMDFTDCMAVAVNKCQAFFNQTVRKAIGRPIPVGHYSGYFFGMQYPAFGWHARTPDMLRSKDMDFQSAPYAYAYRNTGASGLPRAVFETYPLNNKVALMESDVRTHLAVDGNTSSTTQDATNGMMIRDFCNAITRGAALWYFDFQHGWYDHPVYLGFFSKMLNIWQSKPNVSRVSEVCLVCDYDSVKYHTAQVNPNAFTVKLISDLGNNMFKAGAPYDTIYMEDLALPNVPRYKLYVFPNLVHLTPQKIQCVDALLKNGAYIAFLCGPQARERWGKHPHVFCVDNHVNARQLHELYQKTNIFCYTEDCNGCLYACAELVALHRANAGTATITLPKTPRKVTMLFPEEKKMPTDRVIRYSHPKAGTTLFRIQY